MNRTKAVPHQNTVFRQCTANIPWGALDRLIAEHRADRGVRKLSTKDLFLTMLFAQVSGTSSLRDIEAVTDSQQARLYHAGLKPVKRSTLAEAAAVRPVAVFTGVLALMIARATRKLRQGVRECVRLIDSTSIRLNTLSAHWSRFSADLCGVKAHFVYDPDADCPTYLDITPANINDITAAQGMPIEPGATYVFDLGYYRFVTRLKTNTILTVIETLPVPPEAENILSDRIGFLPGRLAGTRQNPMQNAVREIQVRIETGKILRIVSNDLDAPAEEIAALYKRRWAIELFFRWIKQTLKVAHFIGTSENAVRMQIAVALIAFVLIKLAHMQQTVVDSLTRFARLIRANVLHRRSLKALRGSGDAPLPLKVEKQGGLERWWAQ